MSGASTGFLLGQVVVRIVAQNRKAKVDICCASGFVASMPSKTQRPSLKNAQHAYDIETSMIHVPLQERC